MNATLAKRLPLSLLGDRLNLKAAFDNNGAFVKKIHTANCLLFGEKSLAKEFPRNSLKLLD